MPSACRAAARCSYRTDPARRGTGREHGTAPSSSTCMLRRSAGAVRGRVGRGGRACMASSGAAFFSSHRDDRSVTFFLGSSFYRTARRDTDDVRAIPSATSDETVDVRSPRPPGERCE